MNFTVLWRDAAEANLLASLLRAADKPGLWAVAPADRETPGTVVVVAWSNSAMSADVGTPAGDQFVAVFQSVPE